MARDRTKYQATPRQVSGRQSAGSGFKSSKYVGYGIAGAVVLACTGGLVYKQFVQERECVDSTTQQVVDDSQCATGRAPYRWYYGGRSGGIGTTATDGSYERGGFGRVFGGSGGG